MKDHKYNYHGHTYLCGHAGGTPMDYTKKAIELNYHDLGISEHAPMPNLRTKNSRLSLKDYDLYLKLMNEAKDYAKDFNLNIHVGLEVEYFKDLDLNGHYKKFLKDTEYLILGQHYIIRDNELKSTFALDDMTDVLIYVDTVIEALKTGYFNLLAHPELCFFNITNVTDEMVLALRPIIKTAKELDIPLEINANGIRRSFYEDKNSDLNLLKYPKLKFLEMVKEENAKVMITSDCHSVDALDDFAIKEAYKLVKMYDLELVNTLKMNYY